MNKSLLDETEVRRALAIMLAPGHGQVFEIRALCAKLSCNSYKPGTVSGYFDSIDTCIAELKKLISAEGIYVTLNRCDPALLHRRVNRLDYAEKSANTGNDHILLLCWLLIDIDPVRLAGISATDEEKAAGHNKAREVYVFLKERGFPEPVVADSGNGYQLCYRIELPPEDDKLIEKALKALAVRFDDKAVIIDRIVFNPSRIVKLYGTKACKGDDTKERPWRFSKLLQIPELLQPVSREQLEELVEELLPKESEKQKAGPEARTGVFDMDAFLTRYGIAVAERIIEPSGRTKWRLEHCPFNADHETPDAAVFQRPNGGTLGFRCLHTSCIDKHWQDFRQLFEPGYDSPKVSVTSEPSEETGDEITSLSSFDLTPYPAPLGKAAFHGLAGQFVERVLPCTEADPAALLFTFLVTFGNVIGRTGHAIADGARHFCNLNVVLVGKSGKGRKGAARWHTNRLFSCVDQGWIEDCIGSGLSSGEGLISAVQDEVTKLVKNKTTGKEETKIVVPAAKDKRLLVIQTEFSTALKAMEREGNTLSSVIRAAWDCEPKLRTLVKNSPTCATDAHISIIAHITAEEVRPGLSEIEAANGFGNRFLWPPVKRSKELPEGGELPPIADLIEPLQKAVNSAKNLKEPLKRDEAAQKLWASIYHDLSAGKPGLFGAITARSEAQTLRLSDIYALLDCASFVGVQHLEAALEAWRYCEEGVRWSFRTGTGNKNADRILAALAAEKEKGLTKRQIIIQVFNRNTPKHEINEALRLIFDQKLASREIEATATKSAERWFLNSKAYEQYEQSTPEDPKTGDSSYSSYPQQKKKAFSAESDIKAEARAEVTGEPESEAVSTPERPEKEPPAGSASVPLMMTNQMESDLLKMGCSQAEIDKMTPREAWEKLGARRACLEAVGGVMEL